MLSLCGLKGCEGPLAGVACRDVRRDIWHTPSCRSPGAVRQVRGRTRSRFTSHWLWRLTSISVSSQLLATHELGQLLDEEMTDDERRDLEDAEEVCRRFLAWDLVRDDEANSDPDLRQDVKKRMAQVLGRETAE